MLSVLKISYVIMPFPLPGLWQRFFKICMLDPVSLHEYSAKLHFPSPLHEGDATWQFTIGI